MDQFKQRLKAAALESAENPLRSTLFHWLKRNARTFEAVAPERRNWEPVIAKALRAGITDGKGQAPTPRVIRDTWRKVQQQLANERAKAEVGAALKGARPPRKLQPRDMPKDWRPTPITPAPVQAPAGNWQQALSPYVGPITSGPNMPEPDYTGMDEADRKIARMQWAISRRG